MPVYKNYFQKLKEEHTSELILKANIAWITKSEYATTKETKIKQNCRPMSPIKINIKILNKISTNGIHQYKNEMIHFTVFYPRMQGLLLHLRINVIHSIKRVKTEKTNDHLNQCRRILTKISVYLG